MNFAKPKVHKDNVSQDEQSSDCELLTEDPTTEGKNEKVAPLPNLRRAGLRASTRLAKGKEPLSSSDRKVFPRPEPKGTQVDISSLFIGMSKEVLPVSNVMKTKVKQEATK